MSDLRARLKDELPRLIRYSTALTGDADEALDLVEDTLLEALATATPAILDDAELRVWLLTVLHDHRRNPFRQTVQDPSHSAIDPKSSLCQSAFEQAIRQLPEEQRAAILLVGLEGMSYRKTGVILRISTAAVRAMLVRGRENLRRALVETDAADRAAA